MKKSWYTWHRWIGVTALVPVIFWTFSGVMHPLLSNWFRPVVAHPMFMPVAVDTAKVRLNIRDVLLQQRVTEISNIRLVRLDSAYFYQVDQGVSVLRYFNAVDGRELKDGDKRYALQLGRFFSGYAKDAVQRVRLLTGFDEEYREVNRLLPVYCVRFATPHNVDVYVDTRSDRLGTYNTPPKRTFIHIFNNLHNWLFIKQFLGEKTRKAVMAVLLIFIAVSALSGLLVYGAMWKKFKKQGTPKTGKAWLRKYHRQTGLVVSLLMFTFSGSGAFHLLVGEESVDPDTYKHVQHIKPEALQAGCDALFRRFPGLLNISLAQIDDRCFYQVYMPDSMGMAGTVRMVDSRTGEEWVDGDTGYAYYLAESMRKKDGLDKPGMAEPTITEVPGFYGEYGFINKRLPVFKVAYAGNRNYFMETSTGILALKTTTTSIMEGYSFAFLHKYYLLGPIVGMDMRDLLLILSALAIHVLSILGLLMFLRK